MVGTATSLAVLSTAGIIAVFTKLPKGMQQFLIAHSLMTDFFSLVIVYVVLGGTLTALFASAVAGLLISASLHVLNHKKDFIFLWDFAEVVKFGLEKAQTALTNFGSMYKNGREKVVN